MAVDKIYLYTYWTLTLSPQVQVQGKLQHSIKYFLCLEELKQKSVCKYRLQTEQFL